MQPGVESGDVIIVLQQKEHGVFQRHGNDLKCSHSLGITEALCGFQFCIKQLDGRDLVISNAPGNVITPGWCFNSLPRNLGYSLIENKLLNTWQ